MPWDFSYWKIPLCVWVVFWEAGWMEMDCFKRIATCGWTLLKPSLCGLETITVHIIALIFVRELAPRDLWHMSVPLQRVCKKVSLITIALIIVLNKLCYHRQCESANVWINALYKKKYYASSFVSTKKYSQQWHWLTLVFPVESEGTLEIEELVLVSALGFLWNVIAR